MPSIKKSVERKKTATKSSALTTPRTGEDTKKMTKKFSIKEASVSEQDNLTTSSQWPKEPNELEQAQMTNLLLELSEKTDLEKVLEEIESKGSSSASEDFEELKEEMEPELNLSMTEDKRILDFDISSIEMSLSGEELDAERLEKDESESNFLQVFGKLPEVDEVSLDLLEETVDQKKPQPNERHKYLATKPGTLADMGRFFDPVTGLLATQGSYSSLKSLSEKIPSDEESLSEAPEKEVYEDSRQKERFSLADDISKDGSEKSMDDFKFTEDSLPAEDNIFEQFLEIIQPEKPAAVEELKEDGEILRLDQNRLQTEKAVTDFLNKIIDHCVAKVEFNESDAMLERSLDKYKLVCELKSICDSLDFESSKSIFLNRKTVNYFKRKGSLRLITAESTNALALNRANFLTSLSVLDTWLKREEQTKLLNSNRICVLRQQYEIMKQEFFEKINKLEQLIRTTLQRKNFDKLAALVERLIRKMSAIRNEISQVRFKLLLEQHQYCLLKNELDKLEDLGNGLNVRQYESLQTETLAISKKIEEYDTALVRLRRHFNDDLHKVAHAKEKKCTKKSITLAQKHCLQEVKLKERQLREHIHQLKVRRNHLKQERDNLIHQAGLLSNPVLLRDYDRTAEKANKLRRANEDLKKVIKELNSKIEKLD